MRKVGTFHTLLFRVIFVFFVTFFLALLGLGVGFCQAIYHSTPVINIHSLTPKGNSSTLYDKDGNKILSFDKNFKNNDYISLKKIPQDLQNAIILLEDPDFYHHNGITAYTLMNHFVSDLTSNTVYNKNSLITEQLIENLDANLLYKTNFFSRMEYHLRLLFKSVSLEKQASKPEILEYYLNTLSFGNGIIGVESASKAYFGKSVTKLSLAESTVLAVMVSDPVRYNPYTNERKNLKRRLMVLSKMLDNNSITQKDLTTALKDNPYENLLSLSEQEKSPFSSFESATLQQVYQDMTNEFHLSSTKFYTLLSHGQLQIQTTQDSAIQEKIEQILKHSTLDKKKKLNGCISILNHKNGEVLAIAGKASQSSRMMNTASEQTRQPGTLFHVLATYLPGIDTGVLTLASSYEDAPYRYLDNKNTVVSKNKVYQGLMTIRQAMNHEMNIIAARAQSDFPAQTSYQYLNKLGFKHIVESEHNANGGTITDIQQSISSGQLVHGVTNTEVLSAIGTIANRGTRVENIYYTKISNRLGRTIFQKEMKKTKVTKKTSAFLITNALKQTKSKQIGKSELACLKGTSLENTDYWYTGYTPDITACVWLGYNDQRPFDSKGMEKDLWRQTMQATIPVDSVSSFKVPSNLQTADICQVSGKLAVSSICDNDPRGSQIRTEYFAKGTAPTSTCNIHIEATFCKKSKRLISNDCPLSDRIKKIYLILPSGSTKTLDSKYTFPKKYQSDIRCNIHQNKKRNKKSPTH